VDKQPFNNPTKVREALRALVNRENTEPRLVEYTDEGEHKPKDEKSKDDKPLSNQQPPGVFKRLTYFSPYLFCSQFYTKLGTISFSFVFHDSLFSVYKQLKTPNLSNWWTTSTIFIVIIFAIQILFGCIIGLTFGTSTPNNVLTSSYDEGAVFPADNVFAMVIQIGFSISLLLTYPACMVVCREYVESIIVLYKTPAVDGSKEMGRMIQLIVASVLVLLTVPFLFFPDAGAVVDDVLDFVGGLAAGYMAFVLPIILFWKVYGRVPVKGETRRTRDRIVPYVVLVLGFYGCIVAPIFTIAGWCGVSYDMPHPPQGWNTPIKAEM
jgi:amino acid permease